MAKQIKFSHKDKDYTLEFTRKTVAEMEKKGFIASDLTEKPMTGVSELFKGAFLAHHRYVKLDVIEDIFSKMRNKDELISKLGDMYSEPILSLINEPEEAEGNLSWTAD